MEMSRAVKPSFGTGFSAMFRIFTSPSTVFDDIRSGLTVWPALIVWIIVILAVTMAMTPVMSEAIDASIIEQGGDPAIMQGGMGIFVIASQVMGQVIALLIISFFYWLALTISFGGIRFGRVFTLTVYTSFIGLLYQVINVIYMNLVHPEISNPAQIRSAMLDLSVGALFSEGGFLANFLSQLGLFQIWGLILMIFGAAVISEHTRKQATWPILIIFLIGTVLAAFLTGMGGVKVGG